MFLTIIEMTTQINFDEKSFKILKKMPIKRHRLFNVKSNLLEEK